MSEESDRYAAASHDIGLPQIEFCMDRRGFIFTAHMLQKEVHKYTPYTESDLERSDTSQIDQVPSAENDIHIGIDHNKNQCQKHHIFDYQKQRFDLCVSVRMTLIDRSV